MKVKKTVVLSFKCNYNDIFIFLFFIFCCFKSIYNIKCVNKVKRKQVKRKII